MIPSSLDFLSIKKTFFALKNHAKKSLLKRVHPNPKLNPNLHSRNTLFIAIKNIEKGVKRNKTISLRNFFTIKCLPKRKHKIENKAKLKSLFFVISFFNHVCSLKKSITGINI